jgi:hypothetical protein
MSVASFRGCRDPVDASGSADLAVSEGCDYWIPKFANAAGKVEGLARYEGKLVGAMLSQTRSGSRFG